MESTQTIASKNKARVIEAFDTQKAYFATDVTKTYEWRIEQLDRLSRMLKDNELLLELIPKYFEPEVLTAVVGGREIVTALLELPFDFIFLTGSVGAGKAVMKAAAEHLTPVLLELGGQNPAIADETANLPDAAKKIVWGAMAWGGQWCTSPGYAVVHESVAETFVAECKKAVVVSPPDVAIDHLFPPYTKEKVEALNQWFDY